jgi:hypothetical protein
MHAGNHRVGGDDQIVTGRRRQDCRIVADAEAHIGARDRATRSDQIDQVEFQGTSSVQLTRRSSIEAGATAIADRSESAQAIQRLRQLRAD